MRRRKRGRTKRRRRRNKGRTRGRIGNRGMVEIRREEGREGRNQARRRWR